MHGVILDRVIAHVALFSPWHTRKNLPVFVHTRQFLPRDRDVFERQEPCRHSARQERNFDRRERRGGKSCVLSPRVCGKECNRSERGQGSAVLAPDYARLQVGKDDRPDRRTDRRSASAGCDSDLDRQNSPLASQQSGSRLKEPKASLLPVLSLQPPPALFPLPSTLPTKDPMSPPLGTFGHEAPLGILLLIAE